MNRNFRIIFLGLGLFSSFGFSHPKEETLSKLQAIANHILQQSTFQFIDENTGMRFASLQQAPPTAQLKPESPYQDWRYWNGVLNLALLELGKALHDSQYIQLVIKNMAFCFDHAVYFEKRYKGEGKWEYPFGQFFIMEELDDCGAMGASLIEVYRMDPQPRYLEYIEKAATHMWTRQARLPDRTLVRSFPYKWTIWADDLFMSVPFLVRMAELTGKSIYLEDAILQVLHFHKYLFNENAGLMHHGWYSDLRSPTVAFWGRANGWALLAQIELLDHIPQKHPKRKILIEKLLKHIQGIARYQSGEGLWHQLLDKEDSFLETSCSAMFAYTIARAVNKRYIDARYASIAEKAWEGILSKMRSDGKIEGICTGTGIANDLVHYYHRPTPLNDIHGIGPVLLAGIEILRLWHSIE